MEMQQRRKLIIKTEILKLARKEQPKARWLKLRQTKLNLRYEDHKPALYSLVIVMMTRRKNSQN